MWITFLASPTCPLGACSLQASKWRVLGASPAPAVSSLQFAAPKEVAQSQQWVQSRWPADKVRRGTVHASTAFLHVRTAACPPRCPTRPQPLPLLGSDKGRMDGQRRHCVALVSRALTQ